ncbi:LysR family transcriptional regulator [Microbulbifer sp. OS29]|uniref:LysR family transcriptional regulator n=1 Tax=Microbulbifer okhotskensis TaxID=2926617 RepID=A0A9X2EPX8_9GAMM|nr:LysR family transcriptional regulator [Microbulbifer okhotskensis]MCO1335681.1 LysR family transcriptional regulator [Microbulbifer okhotskensis]
MQKTTLEQWRMFKAVVDAGGFNQASSRVHKSQSSIHNAVSNLEAALGVKLFEISGRKVMLTEAGNLMLRRGSYLLEEVSRIEVIAKSLGDGVESELRIAVDGAFPQGVVFQALEKVSAIYPQVNIDIIDTVLSGTNELIQEGLVDLGLSALSMDNSLNDEICLIEFVAVAHKGHPLHQLDHQLTYDDLKSHRQIIVRDSAIQTNRDSGWLGAEQRWKVGSLRASLDLIAQGLGFAWLPMPLVSELLNNGTLKLLPLIHGGTRSNSFYLNFKDQDKLGPAARTFMGELRLLTLNMDTADQYQG